jgi:hypothetical protein
VVAVPQGDSVNLLDLGDGDGEGDMATKNGSGGSGGGGHGHQSTPAVASAAPLALKESVSMSPQRFQEFWSALPSCFEGRLREAPVPSSSSSLWTIAVVEAALRKNNVHIMASGPTEQSGMKFFLYAMEADELMLGSDGALLLAQLVVAPAADAEGAWTATATVKAEASSSAAALGQALANTLLHSLLTLE